MSIELDINKDAKGASNLVGDNSTKQSAVESKAEAIKRTLKLIDPNIRDVSQDIKPNHKTGLTNIPSSYEDEEPLPQKKSFLSRSFKAVKQTFVSSLTRRILMLNLAALLALLGTILYMNQFREGLIDAKTESFLTQGRIIASAIASSATATPDAITIDPNKLWELKTGESLQPRFEPLDSFTYPINPEQIAPLLGKLIKSSETRARIYDPDGILILDSRNLYSGSQVLRFDLPPINPQKESVGWIEYIGNTLNKLFQSSNHPLYKELDGSGKQYEEVQFALTGAARHVVRQTNAGELTVSVAVPVQRFRAVLGVLLLSTEGDGIDRIVREERIAVLRIFLVVAIVLLVLSALLASTIASPLRRLSEAAIRVKRGVKSRVEIPDYSHRQDEVGNLSISIKEMTNSLYQRIEAIESFAADVSHELKNPLTSLRSAVETLPLAKTEDTKKRLMDVIQHDVQRLDRLITDISDASRLDADLARDDVGLIDLAELLKNITAATNEIRRNRQIDITFTIHNKNNNPQNFIVAGHDIRLGQVINNLIDNATSFVPAVGGRVAIGIGRNKNTIIIVIEDNGPGIQAENLDRVFERFYTDRVEQDVFGQNSGLGLSISRQIIEAHGGKIRAENRRDGVSGARFVVMLPADIPSASKLRKNKV